MEKLFFVLVFFTVPNWPMEWSQLGNWLCRPGVWLATALDIWPRCSLSLGFTAITQSQEQCLSF